jgi:hypothetical protein
MRSRDLERRPRAGILQLVHFSDPIALVGVLLSVGLAVALDLTDVAGTADSFLAGLMGTTLALVLDATARAERRFQLRGMLEAADWLPSLLTRAAASVAEIAERYPDSLAEAEARRRIRNLTEELEELQRGRIIRPHNDYDHLLTGVEHCQRSLDGITNAVREPDWWHTELAQHYWRANRAALERGVRIRRIFIYDRLTPELAALVEQQHRAGVQVALAHRRVLDPASNVNIALFDGRSAWQGQMNAHAEIVGNVYLVNRHDVDQLTETFERCWTTASPYEPHDP